MNGGFKVYVALICCSMIAGIPVGSMAARTPSAPTGLTIEEPASTPPTVDPPYIGTDSLLPGKTPANFTLPAGWSLVRTQGFETGGGTSPEWFSPGVARTTTRAHTGSYSARGQFTADASMMEWGLSPTVVGPFNEIYISVWEYVESQALFNEEFNSATLRWVSGSSYQNFVFNYDMVNGGPFNVRNMDISFFGEENPFTAAGQTFSSHGTRRVIPTGRWRQNEYWFKPNTPVANPDKYSWNTQGDGFARWYEDGVLIHSREGWNPTGGIDFKHGGVQVRIGGVYTKHIWRSGDGWTGTCTNAIGQGGGFDRQKHWDDCSLPGVLHNGVNYPGCPNQCPPNGTIPKFYKHLDDIIIMKR